MTARRVDSVPMAEGERLPAADRPSSWTSRPATLTPVIALLVTLVVILQQVGERRYEAYQPETRELYIRSGTMLERMALSFDALLADVYWIRAIQHYGGGKLSDEADRNYELLYPLLDITTTLDPRFSIAYRFGAIFLTEAYPDGPGRPHEAVALLEKGARQMPKRWQFLQDIGFVYYWWLHDYEEAARWFERASEIPSSPWWLKSLAANTLVLGGNRSASRMLWQQMLGSSDNEWMRTEAQRRLLQLAVMDEIDLYAEAVEVFILREGRVPASWQDLVTAGAATQRPVDPMGYPYLLDAGSGKVSVSPQSPLFPLPDEPPGTMP